MENHYSTLGVAETATEEEIKKAYRKLASQHHPDKGGDTEKFKSIQTAYDVIGNKEKRERYDHERRNPGQGHFRFSTSDMDMGGFPPGMEDILRGFGFGGGFRQQQQRRNKDIQIRVTLDLVDTLSKQTRIVTLKTTNGETQTVNVDIPKGVKNGSTIKYNALGDNFFSTLPRGDLYVQILVNQHELFQVHGYDLVAPIDIDAIDAILGTKQVFKVLDGTEFELTIPAGIQGGTKFKIANQGLFFQQQEHRGNMYLIAQIKVPTNLSEAQLEIIKQVKQLNIT
jgi:DnaJ-class molecular chaperone